MNLKILSILMVIGRTSASFGEQLSFPDIWNQINADSSAQQASHLQAQAISESKERASRHWLPRLYLDARSYQSNDPGDNFIGLLEQRSLQTTDFNPSSVNNPGINTFSRGAIGLDLPLYEGGTKATLVEVLKHSEAAQKISTSQIQLEQYSQVGFSYGALAIIERQKNKLQVLSLEIQHLLKSYKIGNKSNPVGYSGLLGIQSLSNRLAGLIKQVDAQIHSHQASLHELGVKQKDWSPSIKNIESFIAEYFSTKDRVAEQEKSFQLQALDESVKAKQESANMEKAKFLPRVGAFAETYSFNGARETATGYNAGVYLKWNLYDPMDYGSLNEAKIKVEAAQKSLENSAQQERTERATLEETLIALKQNVELLNDSDKILLEQTQMTETLFKNGSLNALQMVEVFNRRTDLIVALADAELNLIKTATQIVAKENFLIPISMASGEKNER